MFLKTPSFMRRTPEIPVSEDPAADKAARIKFHREHVRNGPRPFSYVTSGQVRRQRERDAASMQRKSSKRYRRDWMNNRLRLAILRGQLQAVGAIVYESGIKPTEEQQRQAATWIVREFGERDDDGALVFHDDLLKDAVAKAYNTYRDATKVAA